MNKKNTDKNWITDINHEKTFYGALLEYYGECSVNWSEIAGTTDKYDSIYDRIIIPNLPDHDNTPIRLYTKDDYKATMSRIINAGQEKTGSPYAKSTINQFRHLIKVVAGVAFKHGLCGDVLYGTSFNLLYEPNEADEINKRVILKKSLTIKQEIKVANVLLTDYKQDGEKMGLLLMFALGLRNGEACAAKFGSISDINCSDKISLKALWVYESVIPKTSKLQSSGKTKNADRIIPIPELLESFIEKRKEYISKQIQDDENVDDYPIACVGNKYTENCKADQLTEAAKSLFKDIDFNEEELANIDIQLEQGETDEVKEKEPTAYLLRRNFGTHLYILGLTESEIQYIIGHDIEDMYETRNEFVNEERLAVIKQKMDKRPLLNVSCLENKSEAIIGMPIGVSRTIDSDNRKTFRMQLKPGQLKVRMTANEPLDNMKINIVNLSKGAVIKRRIYAEPVRIKYGRNINIIGKYHEMYGIVKKKQGD